MASVVEVLAEAVANHAAIHIIYNGGSKPGAKRPVIPVNIMGGVLFAREPGLPQEKSFKIAKIATVILPDGRSVDNALVKPVEVRTFATPVLSSLAEYVSLLKPQYVAAGWNVFDEEHRLGVGRFAKNGTPRKHPCISVQFMDRSEVVSLDFETGELVTEKKALTGRERPWRVESERQPQAKAFSELHVAMEYFATEVAASSAIKS